MPLSATSKAGILLRNAMARPWRWALYCSGDALRRAKAVRLPRILMYHIVADGYLSPARFTWQLEFLCRHFEVVSLGELIDRMSGDCLRGREIVLTFDDGVRNHFEMVWPLLRKHEIPATFFVCSDLIESEKWLWRTELRQRLAKLPTALRRRVAREAGCAETSTAAIMDWTKSLPLDAIHGFKDAVAALTPRFAPSAKELHIHTPLTWTQLRQMDPRLVTIGSHTRSHPLLPTLSDAQLHDEIVGSKQTLETRLDRSVDYFSYPNGANNPAVADMVRAHYRAAVSSRNGCVRLGEDLASLPRITADGSRATFVRRLHRPTA